MRVGTSLMIVGVGLLPGLGLAGCEIARALEAEPAAMVDTGVDVDLGAGSQLADVEAESPAAPDPPDGEQGAKVAADSADAAETKLASSETETPTESSKESLKPVPAEEAGDAVCPENMNLVEGNYCRLVEQQCLQYATHVKDGPAGKTEQPDKARCMKFAPSECKDDRPPHKMRFCMDRYEYPNKKGAIPHVLTDWRQAWEACAEQGKRLCTEAEFNLACEGEELNPYATGRERDDEKCNIDKPFVKRKKNLLPRLQCETKEWCRAEMERLDGREPAGSRKECVSAYGIHDLNGNVNEWIYMPWRPPGKRSAIKGGWWGPVRNRCRPIVMSHHEEYTGYEVGFRCCSKPLDEKQKSKKK